MPINNIFYEDPTFDGDEEDQEDFEVYLKVWNGLPCLTL